VRVAAELVRAGRALRRAMGLPPDATLSIEPNFAVFTVDAESLDADGAWRVPPSIAVAEANLAAAEKSLALEVERQYPDLTLGPGYGTQDGSRQFVLGLGLRLPIFNANRRAIAEAEAGRELARVSFAAAVEALEADRADARTDWQAASAQRALVESAVLPLAEAQDADLRKLFALGAEIDALVLLDGVQRQNDARLALVDALRAESLAAIRLWELGCQGQERAAAPSDSTRPSTPRDGDLSKSESTP
jgi:outer membrane protein TolC